MTVQELITCLQKCDPNSTAVVYMDLWGMWDDIERVDERTLQHDTYEYVEDYEMGTDPRKYTRDIRTTVIHLSIDAPPNRYPRTRTIGRRPCASTN